MHEMLTTSPLGMPRDRRNTVQEQRRGLSERWDERLELVKEHRDRSKAHQMRVMRSNSN